jgi:hypothetical protein
MELQMICVDLNYVFGFCLKLWVTFGNFLKVLRSAWIGCTLFACLFICVRYWISKLGRLNFGILVSNPHKHGCMCAFICGCVVLCSKKFTTSFLKDT